MHRHRGLSHAPGSVTQGTPGRRATPPRSRAPAAAVVVTPACPAGHRPAADRQRPGGPGALAPGRFDIRDRASAAGWGRRVM